MKNHKIIYILILLFTIFTKSYAQDIKYKLRRFNTDDFYEDENYNSNIKYQLERQNKRYNEIDNVRNQTKKKKKKYEGYYKIGNPYTVLGQTYYPREDPDYEEIGMASWYGGDFHNKRTANGEKYNMNDYTAAHRTLPMPCMVKITNLENGKSVKVRINDRGPFAKNRIIDVSKKVAKKLDFHEQGTTRVKVQYLKEESEELLKEYGLK